MWLYAGEWRRLTVAARKAIGQGDLLLSPMAVLELEFMSEIGRIEPAASKVIEALSAEVGLRVCDLPFAVVVQHALKEKWGRDPFDRLIVANARAADATLVSKDTRILRHYSRAVW
jgi:PIN domain nuclease of toxin-antitoxin system